MQITDIFPAFFVFSGFFLLFSPFCSSCKRFWIPFSKHGLPENGFIHQKKILSGMRSPHPAGDPHRYPDLPVYNPLQYPE